MDNRKKSSSSGMLHRSLGLKECITITVGTVIGVGLFTVGANVVGYMGASVIWATLAALAISIYPALLYAEMSSALPFSGGTYQYASLGLSRPFGMLAGWNFIISMVSVASGEALAFSFYIRTFFSAVGIEIPFDDRVIACVAIIGFLMLGIRGIEITGKLQNAFLFFFWGVAAVWVLTMLPSIHLTNFQSGSMVPQSNFISYVALIWWCFAGFETCCAMGEEIKYPQINLPRALFLAPFLVFAVNGLFQWVLACTIPFDSLQLLQVAAAPYAEGMKLAGIVGFPLILLCIGIAFGGDFSTLNASITAPSRYLFTMSRDGALPAIFAKLHPCYQTPIVATVLLGSLMLLFVSTNSVTYIASLSLFSTLFYYIIGIASSMGLRKKYPNLKRPYKVKGIWVGAPISIIIYAAMMTQLEHAAILAGTVWCLLGIGIYSIQTIRKEEKIISVCEVLPTCEEPTLEELIKMNSEYCVWRKLTIIATLLVVGIYLFPIFM